MAVINRISQQGLPIETFNVFNGIYNVGGAGLYDFKLQPGNNRQFVMKLDHRYYYMIDRVSFSASIPEGVYLSSLLPDRRPLFRLYFKFTDYAVYPFGLPAINYKDNLEFNFWFHSNKENDELQVVEDISGFLYDGSSNTAGSGKCYYSRNCEYIACWLLRI